MGSFLPRGCYKSEMFDANTVLTILASCAPSFYVNNLTVIGKQHWLRWSNLLCAVFCVQSLVCNLLCEIFCEQSFVCTGSHACGQQLLRATLPQSHTATVKPSKQAKQASQAAK